MSKQSNYFGNASGLSYSVKRDKKVTKDMPETSPQKQIILPKYRVNAFGNGGFEK